MIIGNLITLSGGDGVSKKGDTMEGALVAANGDVTVAQVRNTYAGMADLEEGVSKLPEGTTYLVYE